MGVQKITFDTSSVSAKVDADIYNFLLSDDTGIFQNFKNSVSYTLSSNVITFKDGYVSIYGRLLYIENDTQITIATDSSRYGLVVLGVNTTNNSATIYTKEATSSYPALTKTNLLNGNGLYELVLCAYSKTTSYVTLDSDYQRLYIVNYKTQISELKTYINTRFIPNSISPTKVSNGVYRVSNLSSQILQRSIIQVIIGGTTVVTIPGVQIFIVVGSNTSTTYRHNGADYSLYFSYAAGDLNISCGATNHTITKVVLTTL